MNRGRVTALVVVLAACLVACSPGEPEADASAGPEPLRLVTLAPHLAEIVAAAGAADVLVGVSAYTDYPASVTDLPIVGDGFRIDAEALLALKPTHVLAWGGGGQIDSIALVKELGLNLVTIETRGLDDIAPAIREVGALAGTESVAAAVASRFESEIAALSYDGARLSVFYQIGERPLYTINGDHFISDLMARCGGDNVFGDLETLAPVVSVEAVVRADPNVILTGSDATAIANMWQRWPDLGAVENDRILGVPGDLIGRPGPRLAAGGRAICETLTAARQAER
ncbi:MAG: helical backbone metal receptor [Pseudomonadota bacterium]